MEDCLSNYKDFWLYSQWEEEPLKGFLYNILVAVLIEDFKIKSKVREKSAVTQIRDDDDSDYIVTIIDRRIWF